MSSGPCGCRWAPVSSVWWRRPVRRTSPRTTRPTSGSCTATTSTRRSAASGSGPSSGVPLVLEGKVVGALLAVHRSVRRFPPSEVSLLTSFAAHAAVALENARLFADARPGQPHDEPAHRVVERAALAHDRLTDLLLHGGGVEEVAGVLAEVLGGRGGRLRPRRNLRAGHAATGGLARGRARGAGLGAFGAVRRATSPPRPRARTTSRHWCCHGAGRGARPGRAPHAGARCSRHRTGAPVRPVGGRDRGAARW